ncbi:MAG: RNA-binding transcriptional accessory protein, partial [Clostridia bacterium]|nr:RNA-binding transcriptional accessory protein [Clostridia bacterium]
MNIPEKLTAAFNLKPSLVDGIIALIDDGSTIPFIARYRKEITGNLDDQVLRAFAEQLESLRNLETRRSDVIRLLGEQGVTDPELLAQVGAADSLTRLEDLYRPYRPKRKTRASVARALGLGDLAGLIWAQKTPLSSLEKQAAAKAAEVPELPTAEAALAGAMDIVAEQLADDAAIRAALRALFWRESVLFSKAKKKEDSVYRQYYDFSEPVKRIAGHRVLAIDRGEREEFLSVALEVPEGSAPDIMERAVLRPQSACPELIRAIVADAWKRLIAPSLENEIRSELTTRAQEKAITVFAENLRSLLMVPPIRGKTVLGLDPGYRNGCKLAVVDPTGRLLTTGVIYPTPPLSRIDESSVAINKLLSLYPVDLIAIGNGTASRETEQFVRTLIKNDNLTVRCLVVSEAGASVYSASPKAAAEFPDLDVNVRSAV